MSCAFYMEFRWAVSGTFSSEIIRKPSWSPRKTLMRRLPGDCRKDLHLHLVTQAVRRKITSAYSNSVLRICTEVIQDLLCTHATHAYSAFLDYIILSQ